ncbi:EAL domain-containing protein [Pseudoroseomonas globiformis]|uniref:EAL domain-containing protein n=1 Tax=Teichococcus globiformis TaxID=2307229 RepID=A0ABV7G0R5_9PROT
MALRFSTGPSDVDHPLLLLADDPEIVRATQAAARGMAHAPQRVADGRTALRHLFGTGTGSGSPPRHLVCQPSAAGSSWPALLATALDPFSHTGIVVVREDGVAMAGVDAVLPRAEDLAQALRAARWRRTQSPATDPAALAIGLARGEITVRYQPILRLSDRRPVLLEGLARWHRPDDSPLGPDLFVPLAESSGQSRALTAAVAEAAFAEMAPAAARVGASLSVNLPLTVLLEQDVLSWLNGLMARHNFPASALTLELTETIPVRDRSALRRALRRLERAGLPVLIDDMGLEEDRAALMELPFAGIKLDRHLVGAMPTRRRARAEVERLVALAHSRRMSVTAEGVSDARLWRAVTAAGADHAQGFAVSRPLPAAALPGWASAWRNGPPRQAHRHASGSASAGAEHLHASQ